MLGAIKSPGAITIHPFSFSVDFGSRIGVMEKVESVEVFLYPTVEISVFKTTPNFLIVGCATCNDNKGWLRFYNPRNTKLLKGLPGTSNSHMFVGRDAQVRMNTGMTD